MLKFIKGGRDGTPQCHYINVNSTLR